MSVGAPSLWHLVRVAPGDTAPRSAAGKDSVLMGPRVGKPHQASGDVRTTEMETKPFTETQAISQASPKSCAVP